MTSKTASESSHSAESLLLVVPKLTHDSWVAWSKLVLERIVVFGDAHTWLKTGVKPKICKPALDDLVVVPDTIDSDDDDPEPVIYVYYHCRNNYCWFQ